MALGVGRSAGVNLAGTTRTAVSGSREEGAAGAGLGGVSRLFNVMVGLPQARFRR